MRIPSYSLHLLLACLVTVSIAACDQSSQNIDFESGSNLTINGPTELTVPNYDSTVTGEFQIRAFTVEQDYEWSFEGVISLDETRRDGENAVVSTSEPGPYAVSATTTIDGQEYSGTTPGEAAYPTILDQAAKYNFNVFGSLVSSVGYDTLMASGVTHFGPSDAAFYDALDESGDGSLDDAETPAPGVLLSILEYHTAVDSLTSSEVTSGEVASTLHPEETLTLSENGGISVNGSNVETSDIATSEGVVLHQIDEVLLPESVVSINPQIVIRDTVDNVDSVAVEGTYVVNDGFVALHEAESGDIIGSSDLLDAGFHGNEEAIRIELDNQLSDTTDVVAMPHEDNGDGLFVPTLDGPYTRGNSSVPVTDTATVFTP